MCSYTEIINRLHLIVSPRAVCNAVYLSQKNLPRVPLGGEGRLSEKRIYRKLFKYSGNNKIAIIALCPYALL